jgi:hypothetical protein
MKRRTLLASVAGGVAAVAGCLSDSGTSDDPTDTETPTDTPTDVHTPTPTDAPNDGTPTPTDTPGSDSDVSVTDVRLQHGVVTPSSPDSIGVFSEDTQYLAASLTVDGSLSREDITLEAGTETFAPTTEVRLFRTAWGDAEWYTDERGSGVVLFEGVQRATDDDPRLTWPGGEWSLGDAVASRLGQDAPEFTVEMKAPKTHDSTSPPPLHIDVTNESERTGRFLGALNRQGPRVAYTPVEVLSEVVPAGETTTLSVSDDWMGLPSEERIGDGDPDVTYSLDYLGGEASAEIRVVESSQ